MARQFGNDPSNDSKSSTPSRSKNVMVVGIACTCLGILGGIAIAGFFAGNSKENKIQNAQNESVSVETQDVGTSDEKIQASTDVSDDTQVVSSDESLLSLKKVEMVCDELGYKKVSASEMLDTLQADTDKDLADGIYMTINTGDEVDKYLESINRLDDIGKVDAVSVAQQHNDEYSFCVEQYTFSSKKEADEYFTFFKTANSSDAFAWDSSTIMVAPGETVTTSSEVTNVVDGVSDEVVYYGVSYVIKTVEEDKALSMENISVAYQNGTDIFVFTASDKSNSDFARKSIDDFCSQLGLVAFSELGK